MACRRSAAAPLAAGDAQRVQRVADRRQRVAQLVRERRQELVLAPVGLAQRVLDPLALADVDHRAAEAEEGAVGCAARRRGVEREAIACRRRGAAGTPSETASRRSLASRNALCAAARSSGWIASIHPIPRPLPGDQPGELVPRPAEEAAAPVGLGDPDHHRRVVGELAEARLALAQRILEAASQARQLEPGRHARQQLAGRERLDQVVVGAGCEPSTCASSPARADSRITGIAPRALVGAQRAQQPEAVEARHHHVGEHQVGRRRAGSPRAPPRRRPRPRRRSARRAGAARSRACRRCRRRAGCARAAVAAARARRVAGALDLVLASRVRQPAQRLVDEGLGARRARRGTRVATIWSAGRCARPPAA